MIFDGVLANRAPVGDFFIGETEEQVVDDVHLAMSQPVAIANV
jgi:hypothetical protein